MTRNPGFARRPGGRPSVRPHLEPLAERCLLSVTDFIAMPVLPVIDPLTKAHLQNIFQWGQALGNHPNAFSKVGDSITATPDFLTQIADPTYDPTSPLYAGSYTGLTATITYFRYLPVDAAGADSFNHSSWAAQVGWTTSEVLNPAYDQQPGWAAVSVPGENPLQTELRLTQPAFALIMLGTNDMVFNPDPTAFAGRLAQVAETCIARGVIPVLSTIPDDAVFGGAFEARVLAYNEAIYQVAGGLNVPLWNYWLAMQSLPFSGLGPDTVHPSVSPWGGSIFTPGALAYGYNLRNLEALQVLDKLVRVVEGNSVPDIPVVPLAPAVTKVVTDLYATLLRRAPSAAELNSWGLPLQWGLVSRAQVAQGIWDSPEHRGIEVVQYYQTYLHRTPGPGEVAIWVNAFAAGAGETDVQIAIVSSPEYAADHPTSAGYVAALYQDALGRAPDGSSDAYVAALGQGVSRAEVALFILTSPEKELDLINGFYSSFLRRTPSPAEAQPWLMAMQLGMAAETVGQEILGSLEYWTLP